MKKSRNRLDLKNAYWLKYRPSGYIISVILLCYIRDTFLRGFVLILRKYLLVTDRIGRNNNSRHQSQLNYINCKRYVHNYRSIHMVLRKYFLRICMKFWKKNSSLQVIDSGLWANDYMDIVTTIDNGESLSVIGI